VTKVKDKQTEHHRISTHTTSEIEIGKTFCGHTDGQMDTPEFQSIRSLPGDDLKINVQLEGHAISLFSRSYTKALEMSHYKALYKSMDTLLYFVSRANILMSSTMQVGNSKQDHLLNNTLIRISVHIQ